MNNPNIMTVPGGILAGSGEAAIGVLLRLMQTDVLLRLLEIGKDKIKAGEEEGEQAEGTLRLTAALMAELRRRNEATAEEATA